MEEIIESGESANIINDNGTLCIYFYGEDVKDFYRDVKITRGLNGGIVVNALQTNWAFINHEFVILGDLNPFLMSDIEKVKPEYIEEYQCKFRKWFKKYASIERRIGSGYVELKDTNVPITITTNNYIIYK